MLRRTAIGSALVVTTTLGLAGCLGVPAPSSGQTWESAALADGSPRLVFGMQETSGSTIRDSIGGGAVVGTVKGTGVTFAAPGPGTRSSIHSAGTGFIQVPNAPSMQLSGTQMSLEVIAKSDEANPSNWMTVQDFQTPSDALNLHGFAMYANGGGGPNTNNVEMFTNNQDGYYGIHQPFQVSWDTNWHDWTWVLGATGGHSWLRLYRDGVLIGGPVTYSVTYTLSPNTNPLILLGAWNAASTTLQDWHGSVAGFAVYASALTQSQITNRYNAIFGN